MIPDKGEYIEAHQVLVNQKRADLKKTLSVKELSNLELLEELSTRLKEAEVDFYLLAQSYDKLWQFHWSKLEQALLQNDDPKKAQEFRAQKLSWLVKTWNDYFNFNGDLDHKTLVIFDSNIKPLIAIELKK